MAKVSNHGLVPKEYTLVNGFKVRQCTKEWMLKMLHKATQDPDILSELQVQVTNIIVRNSHRARIWYWDPCSGLSPAQGPGSCAQTAPAPPNMLDTAAEKSVAHPPCAWTTPGVREVGTLIYLLNRLLSIIFLNLKLTRRGPLQCICGFQSHITDKF